MKGNCKSCDATNVELHQHHIVPRSRGGPDTEANLITLCTGCHGKVHDVSFKTDGGVIKQAISKSKQLSEESRTWLEDNEQVVEDMLEELYNVNIDLYNFLVSSLNLGAMRVDILFSALHPDNPLRKKKLVLPFLLKDQETLKKIYEGVKGDSI
jgi:hypothetical protein